MKKKTWNIASMKSEGEKKKVARIYILQTTVLCIPSCSEVQTFTPPLTLLLAECIYIGVYIRINLRFGRDHRKNKGGF